MPHHGSRSPEQFPNEELECFVCARQYTWCLRYLSNNDILILVAVQFLDDVQSTTQCENILMTTRHPLPTLYRRPPTATSGAQPLLCHHCHQGHNPYCVTTDIRGSYWKYHWIHHNYQMDFKVSSPSMIYIIMIWKRIEFAGQCIFLSTLDCVTYQYGYGVDIMLIVSKWLKLCFHIACCLLLNYSVFKFYFTVNYLRFTHKFDI